MQISCIGRERKSVKNYENWFTLLKVIAIRRMTFLLDHFLLSNPALTPLQKRSFQLAKMHAIFTLIFDNFSGGIAPRPNPHTGEGLRRPSRDPTPLGAAALRASLGTFSPSIDGLKSAPPQFKFLATPLSSWVTGSD